MATRLSVAEFVRRAVDAGSGYLLRWMFRDQWLLIQAAEAAEGFDATYDTRTDGVVFWQNYVATPVGTFDEVIRRLPSRALGASFIDIGSGRGRAVLLASRRFPRVVGVEINPELHEEAVRNRQSFESRAGRATPIELVRADARDYLATAYPRDDVVLYLYAPFAPAQLRELLRIVRRCHAREHALYLIFVNPLPHYVRVIESFDEFRCTAKADAGNLFLSFYRSFRIYEAYAAG